MNPISPPMEFILLIFFLSLHIAILLQKWDPNYHFLPPLSLSILAIAKHYYSSLHSTLYLVDFSCLRPPNSCRVPFSTFLEHTQILDFLDKQSVSFMYKLLTRSGQGEQTYLPPAIHYIPPKSSQEEAIQEVHMTLFPILEDLFTKTKINPLEIDILIVNCSGFCPSPSLSSIIVNKFNMRNDIKSFTISGMGCSASALAINMACNMLKSCKNANAVVVSTEILSTGWYPGRERSMMIVNCLFRMGAAAILVTNKRRLGRQAKYKLVCSIRTQTACDDTAYCSVSREEDGNGLTGVTFLPNSMQVAAETIRSHITIFGSKVLPYTEILHYAFSILKKKYFDKSTEIYVPNFKTAIQHLCLPSASKAWISDIRKGLKLEEKDVEPALMTIHRFGNQSSSALWYELAYIEAMGRVKRGDRVWQLGVGTGLKCGSLVWECIGPIVGEAQKGPWADTIHMYPISMK